MQDATEASVKVTLIIMLSDWKSVMMVKVLTNVHYLLATAMQNMKQRAEKWKALLKVHSEPGKGTRILLEMKVN
jgi:nitrate/nitrite-specific signal transduction histidine kinase